MGFEVFKGLKSIVGIRAQEMVTLILPTFKRSSEVVSHSITSILADAGAVELISEIILIDQNAPPIEVPESLKSIGYLKESVKNIPSKINLGANKFLHLVDQAPSLTRAQNLGVRFARGRYLVFFDDDITVIEGSIQNYVRIFEAHPEVSFLAGRETLPTELREQSSFKIFLKKWIQRFSVGESEYKNGDQFVCRIKNNSFIVADFDQDTAQVIKVDGARGCNWACRTEAFNQVGGFDEAYQGTALRGETDLQVRLGRTFGPGLYAPRSQVIHHRQLGGCENLSTSLKSLKSKFENETYFQKKNFPGLPKIYFLLRTVPLMISALKDSNGFSFLIWVKYGLK